MEKLKILDLFSGIGGISYGMEKTGGFETVAFCEMDKHCHKVLKRHWPDVTIFNDVQKMLVPSLPWPEEKWNNFKKDVDIIAGGFPCQDISVGGKRRGIGGERSGLWKEFKRLIEEIRPSYAIIENVERLRKDGLGVVLEDLSEIGYDVEWHCITARAVGLSHQRDRLWAIAYPRSERQHERFGEKRHIQINEEWQSEASHTDGKKRIIESLPFRALLSKGAIETSFNTLAKYRTALSKIRRVTNGVPEGLHERERKQRIKQLGNSVVPQIPQIIGQAILDYEGSK